MQCHYYPRSDEPAYMHFLLTLELMTVVFNMALIPQCRASGQETRTRTLLVSQLRGENGITTLPLRKKSLFQKGSLHLAALKCAVINYKIAIATANVKIKIYSCK